MARYEMLNPPSGEHCGSCYFGRNLRVNATVRTLVCALEPPSPAYPYGMPEVGSDFWCGRWSQTSLNTRIVLATVLTIASEARDNQLAAPPNRTSGTLADTTGLIFGKYYGIEGSKIPPNTVFMYDGTTTIVLSNPAAAAGDDNVTILDQL